MNGIKIPVSAELNQQDIGQQIKQVEGALNDLGRVAEEAGRARFTPISKISLDDVRKMRQEFEAMVRLTNLASWPGDGSSIISPRCGFHLACWKGRP